MDFCIKLTWYHFKVIIIHQSLEEILSFATKKSMIKCSKQLVIDFNNRILLQILRAKSCSHILIMHLINKQWRDNRKTDVIFSLQVFIHMESMIDDKMTWISKISYENVTKIKSFQI
jgi:hypothetical protein